MKTRCLWLCTLILALCASCGYHLAGRGDYLPSHIKTIGVPPFDSQVPRPGVAERLTEAVTRELIKRGGYRVVPETEGADAVLEGTLSGFITTPIAFDSTGRATRTLLTIQTGVELRDTKDDEVLFENNAFLFRTELEQGIENPDYFDPESEGVEQIAKDFGRSLVATIMEGF